MKDGKKLFKKFIDYLEDGEKFVSPKGTWLNKKNISQDDLTGDFYAYDELLVGEQDYGFGDKRKRRYSPETLEYGIGKIVSEKDAKSFKQRPSLMNARLAMAMKRRQMMRAEGITTNPLLWTGATVLTLLTLFKRS